ncbi:hypothetical protein EC973_002898 [Apophysomyces ossiformis]|uniref:Thioesterase n=1 Tax=Apophysomyces ossiformis TaxID=679940 RepID=A0A8H7BK15_9FUNG|nr:hypothetical protein EC973_002898 [Apophysomyces ossiformis]
MSSPLRTSAAVAAGSGILLGLAHLKSLPMAYTVRSWLILRSLVKRAKANQLNPDPLFSVVSLNHRCYWDDIDYNQHMNNSTYNKNLDFSRIYLLYTILPRVMMEPDHHIFAHNAGVLTLFKKEIAPLQRYTIQSRIWTWNNKWLWLQHRFVFTRDNKQVVACIAVSKIVFKRTSGKTVAPAHVLELCGHELKVEDENRRAREWEIAGHLLELDVMFKNPEDWDSPLAKL